MVFFDQREVEAALHSPLELLESFIGLSELGVKAGDVSFSLCCLLLVSLSRSLLDDD